MGHLIMSKQDGFYKLSINLFQIAGDPKHVATISLLFGTVILQIATAQKKPNKQSTNYNFIYVLII